MYLYSQQTIHICIEKTYMCNIYNKTEKTKQLVGQYTKNILVRTKNTYVDNLYKFTVLNLSILICVLKTLSACI